MLQNHSSYTLELRKKINTLYEDTAKLSRVVNSDRQDDKSSFQNLRKYSQMFANDDMESDDDDIYEVLENEMANIENEESIKRYLTLNPTIWLMNNVNREEACEILQDKQIGQFIVRNSSQEDTFALSIRVPQLNKPVNHYLLIKSDIGYEAQGSNLFFPTLPSLLAHFCSYQSGGMPCLLKPPKVKRPEKCYHSQGQAYSPDPDFGSGRGAEMNYNSTNEQIQVERAPVLRQTNSVPVSTERHINRVPPPPSSDNLIPKPEHTLHAIPPRIPPLHHPILPPSNNDYLNRSYMDPRHQLPATSELEEQTDYASIEYDTPVHFNPNFSQRPPPTLPPRTYLNQQEVEYSDPLLSPDANEYDQPGESRRNPLSLNRVRTTEERHSSHAHRFLPPPIPPKTASMLIESRRTAQDGESYDSSQEVKRGILYNSIRLNQVEGQILHHPASVSHNRRISLETSDDYLDMEPKETSFEMEKDIELQVHHNIKHKNASSKGETSPTYVNVTFNTIATFKGVKQQEIPFEVGFDQQSVATFSQPLPPPRPSDNCNGSSKEQQYNMFTPVSRHPATSALPPIKPLSSSKQNYNNSRKEVLGERLITRPRPSPRSPSNERMVMMRRSNSAEILDTPRKTEKPPLLPKPRIIHGNDSGSGSVQHRRSSSSHECYNNHRISQSHFSAKETLTRKRSAPSPTEGAQPKPILRGVKLPNGRERDFRKVNFSGSTEVRETAKKIDDRDSNQLRTGRSRSPVSHFRPAHPPPPPPPPTRRHSTNFAQPLIAKELSDSRINQVGHRVGPNKGMTYPSNYMQPIPQFNHVAKSQTLDRASFCTNDEERIQRRKFAERSGEKFIKGLRESPSKMWELTETSIALNSHGRSVKIPSKPQSESTNTRDNLNNGIDNENLNLEEYKKVALSKRSKYKKSRTPSRRVAMYIYRLNGRTHPMGNKIHSFNKAILKRQQSDGNVNIEKTLVQVRRFIDGVKKHLMTAKIDVITHKYRDQLNGNTTKEDPTDMDELTDKIDVICENCLYNLILKPLYEHLIKEIRDYLNKNQDLEKIANNFAKGLNRSPLHFGIRANLIPPDEATTKEMSNILLKLSDVFSPLLKLELLLDAVKLVYKSIRDEKHPGKTDLSLGADDFLPIFIYTLVHTEMKEIEVEFLYTWNLLDQTLLSGEGGYYLTTLCTAIEVLKQADFNSKENNINNL